MLKPEFKVCTYKQDFVTLQLAWGDNGGYKTDVKSSHTLRMDCSVGDNLCPAVKVNNIWIFTDSGFLVEGDGVDVILIIYNF